MWPCRPLLALLTRSTPCLRAVRRSKGLKRLRRKVSAAPPSSSPPPSAQPTASATAVPQKPPATRSPAASPSPPSHNTAATAAAASPLSAPGSPVPPTSALSLAALATAVEHLKEFSRRTQHTLRTQDESLQLLQQRFTLLQQQVGQLEGVADGLRGKLTEVHRSVGEMVLGQRNTDLLVQQMERQLLTLRIPTTTSAIAAAVSKPSQEPGEGSARESEGAQSAAAAAKTPTTTPASPAPVAASTEPSNAPQPAQPQQASSLAQQVAQLEARVNQLVLEMFTADRLLSAASSASVTARLAALLSSCSTAAKRAAVMEALHQQHALHTFTDATGATRVTSQCVRLHNVPLNLGAAEVRELCVQHVCQGDSSGFVSCVVRRHPPPMLPQEAAAADQCPQPQQRQGRAEYVSRASSSSANTNATTAAAAASAATVGALPRGDAVGALRPNTKSFEVVFASSALAVEALRVLNGLQLKPTMHSEAVPLAVEPVVSADVLSTLTQMEAAAEKKA